MNAPVQLADDDQLDEREEDEADRADDPDVETLDVGDARQVLEHGAELEGEGEERADGQRDARRDGAHVQVEADPAGDDGERRGEVGLEQVEAVAAAEVEADVQLVPHAVRVGDEHAPRLELQQRKVGQLHVLHERQRRAVPLQPHLVRAVRVALEQDHALQPVEREHLQVHAARRPDLHSANCRPTNLPLTPKIYFLASWKHGYEKRHFVAYF